MAGTSEGTTNTPASVVWTVRRIPFDSLETATWAPGTDAPVASCTFPEIAPMPAPVWANAHTHDASASTITPACFIKDSYLFNPQSRITKSRFQLNETIPLLPRKYRFFTSAASCVHGVRYECVPPLRL